MDRPSSEEAKILRKPLTFITSEHKWRGVNEEYVQHLAEKIDRLGVKPKPLEVTPDGILFGGRHRVRAFRKLGIEECWMHIDDPRPEKTLDAAAKESNEADSEALPETFVDHAERIWEKLEGQTQQEVADELDWSRSKVAQYSRLQNISRDAWKIVTEETKSDLLHEGGAVTGSVTAVTFTEGLLRTVVSLTDEQQEHLVAGLANRGMKKDTFREKADAFQRRNAVSSYIRDKLSGIDDDLSQAAFDRVGSGDFDRAWNDGPSSKLKNYVSYMKEKQLDRQQFELYHADIEDTPSLVDAESVDWVITDPPYPKEYLPLYSTFSEIAHYALKPGGSALVMCGQTYLPEVIDRLTEHLAYHWTIAYLTPGGQAVQQWQREVNTFWKPVIWLTKGEYEGEWVGDVVKSDVNDNDKRFHDWGQSISGMVDLVERFTYPGDTILDPFLGGGTTGVAALDADCQFIGLDNDEDAVETSQARLMTVVNDD